MACSNVLLRKKEQKEVLDNPIITTNTFEEEEENDLLDYEIQNSKTTPSISPSASSTMIQNEQDVTEDTILLAEDHLHNHGIYSKQEGELRLFSIVTQTELGLCAEQFLGRIGKFLFYLVIIFYLYGDLAIYAVSVPKSVLKVTGPIFSLSEVNTFRIFALIFAIIIVPICYLSFSKTKYLQLFTMFLRNTSLLLMIVLCLIFIIEGKGSSWKDLKLFDLGGIETLYGVTIYSFMCHHSLPGIVSPIKDKRNLGVLFSLDFISIFMSYVSLCYVSIFAFGSLKNEQCTEFGNGRPCQIQELFTYNFKYFSFTPIGYFLALFPVFTLSSNFPLIAMTLRGNILTLFKDVKFIQKMHWLPQRILFSSIATLPPVILIFFFMDITKLASLTGGFAGLGIQFIFPAIMVFQARRKMKQVFRKKDIKNPHASWFKSFIWIEVIVGFACLGLLYQSVLQIISIVKFITEWINSFK